jgi:hypothetical protein
MDKPIEWRSNWSKKLKIYFNEIVQSLGPSKPSTIPKKPSKTSKGSIKALPTTIIVCHMYVKTAILD